MSVPGHQPVRPIVVRYRLSADRVDRPVLLAERLIEGDRAIRMQRDKARGRPKRSVRKIAKHTVWLIIAPRPAAPGSCITTMRRRLVRDLTALHLDRRRSVVHRSLHRHDLSAGRMGARAGLHLYVPVAALPVGDGRSQNADRHLPALARRAARQDSKADCCNPASATASIATQCVAVCPTGIDIRDGLQLQCIGCGLCIDACDEVMDAVGRPAG